MMRAMLVVLAAAALLVGPPAAGGIRRVEIGPEEGGRKLSELLRTVTEHTGRRFAYDADVGDLEIDFVRNAPFRVPEDQLLPWLESLLSFHRVVLVPGEDGVWSALRVEPTGCRRPVVVFEDGIGEWADREDVYVVSPLALRLPEVRDRAVRLEAADLRVAAVPGDGTLVVTGFAPDVAAALRKIRGMERAWIAREVSRREERLADCRAEAAAARLVRRIRYLEVLVPAIR